MYILPWNFLRLLHGLCFLELVEGMSVEITKSGDRFVAANSRQSIEDFKMIQILTQNTGTLPEAVAQNKRFLCLNDLCMRTYTRTRREVAETDKHAQFKKPSETDTDEKYQHELKSIITPYAFGNPSLPGNQPKKGKKKPKKSRG